MQLIAKDGIYLTTAPRAVAQIVLFSGSRADVAVQCSGVGSLDLIGTYAAQGLDAGVLSTTAMTLDASTASASALNISIVPFSVYRPCYLVDTLSSTPDQTVSLTMGGGTSGVTMNGVLFASQTTYLETIHTGTLVEMNMPAGLGMHFFLHIKYVDVA